MLKYAKKIDGKDNVVTLVADVEKGEEVTVRFNGEEKKYKVNNEIPFGHKLAIENIGKGKDIYKYGFKIGIASKDITKGDWVHTHNVKDTYKCIDKDGTPLPGQEDD